MNTKTWWVSSMELAPVGLCTDLMPVEGTDLMPVVRTTSTELCIEVDETMDLEPRSAQRARPEYKSFISKIESCITLMEDILVDLATIP